MPDPTATITMDLTPQQLTALLRAEGEAAYARGSLCHKLAGAMDHLVQGELPAQAVIDWIDSHADLLLAALPAQAEETPDAQA